MKKWMLHEIKNFYVQQRQYYKFEHTLYYLGPILFVKSQNYVTLPSNKSSSHVRYLLHKQCNVAFLLLHTSVYICYVN